jgi:hypothetical protein
MKLRAEIETYREPSSRAVSVHRFPGDRSVDNGILFSATYLTLLDLKDQEAERAWFYDFIRSCEFERGLYRRYPGGEGFDAHDDYVGILVASKLLGLPFAAEIVEYGERHGWIFGGQEQETAKHRAFWRFSYFKALAYACAGKRVGLGRQLLASLTFLENAHEPREHTSGKCLLHLVAIGLEDQRGPIRATLALWRAVMRKRYPLGLGELYSVYFGPEHPLARAAAGRQVGTLAPPKLLI